MKSQEDMNQLNKKIQYWQKGKEGIGYIEEGESSKKGAQKNQRATCNHYGKLGHTSNKCWSNGKAKSMKNATIVISMVIELMNAKRNLNLKENVKTKQILWMKNQDIKSKRIDCENYIRLGLQHMV